MLVLIANICWRWGYSVAFICFVVGGLFGALSADLDKANRFVGLLMLLLLRLVVRGLSGAGGLPAGLGAWLFHDSLHHGRGFFCSGVAVADDEIVCSIGWGGCCLRGSRSQLTSIMVVRWRGVAIRMLWCILIACVAHKHGYRVYHGASLCVIIWRHDHGRLRLACQSSARARSFTILDAESHCVFASLGRCQSGILCTIGSAELQLWYPLLWSKNPNWWASILCNWLPSTVFIEVELRVGVDRLVIDWVNATARYTHSLLQLLLLQHAIHFRGSKRLLSTVSILRLVSCGDCFDFRDRAWQLRV